MDNDYIYWNAYCELRYRNDIINNIFMNEGFINKSEFETNSDGILIPKELPLSNKLIWGLINDNIKYNKHIKFIYRNIVSARCFINIHIATGAILIYIFDNSDKSIKRMLYTNDNYNEI